MFGISVERGAHRRVFLTRRYALKCPRPSSLSQARWANRSELERWKAATEAEKPHLCPVVWCHRRAFFLLMPYARSLTDEEYEELKLEYINPFNENPTLPEYYYHDFKRQNYGVYQGRIVRIDYAEVMRRAI
jgi:hypothetical protein